MGAASKGYRRAGQEKRGSFYGQYLPVSLYIEAEGPSSKQKRLLARRSRFHPRPTEEVIKGESRYLYIPIYRRRNKKAGPSPASGLPRSFRWSLAFFAAIDETPPKGRKGAHEGKKPGGALFSPPRELPSPLRCLTSVFGMGTGVPTAPSPPDFFPREPSVP